jgi:hypothetical protein
MYNGGRMIPALCIVVIFFVALGYFRLSFSSDLPRTGRWKSLPKTAEGWLHLVLIPVKTYAAVAYPFLTVSLRVVSRVSLLRDDAPLTAPLISRGYLIAVSVLLLGALAQTVICRFFHAIETLSFVLLGIAFWWMTSHIYFMGR